MPELANSAGFMLYPRGFFGAVAAPAIKRQPRPFAKEVNRLQNDLNIFLSQSGGKLTLNENVEALHARMVNDFVSFGDFDFREKVLKTALKAFGTLDFYMWYSQQKYSPSAGEMHRAFLIDTLKFIEHGERRMPVNNWNDLISYADKGEPNATLSEEACEFFGISSNGIVRERRNYDLLDIIAKWTSQPGGWQDMLGSLHIFFGVQR